MAVRVLEVVEQEQEQAQVQVQAQVVERVGVVEVARVARVARGSTSPTPEWQTPFERMMWRSTTAGP